MDSTVRTRFAPSPTGYLHIGGARTALFNFLLARRLGGRFVLRIEDTDQTRNVADAAGKLMDDLRWLGLQWDEGPGAPGVTASYYQSQRLDRYREAARRLLDAGHAYYAFETREELDQMRSAAQKAKRPFRYPRPSRFPSDSDAEKARAEGRPVVVRCRMPNHPFTIHDQILGDVHIAATDLDDFVLVKSDGWPTYHFAVVIDDEEMQITHVVRAKEHLINTPLHLALQELLGFRTPIYAHVPIILDEDGSKMSKRAKDKLVRAAVLAALESGRLTEIRAAELAGCATPAAFAAWRDEQTQLDSDGLNRIGRTLHVPLPEIEIRDFRENGYLPEVIVNYIALLGWSPGNDLEKMTLPQMCELFGLDRVGKNDARFDRTKLLSFNTDAIAAAAPQRRLAGMRDYLAVNPESPLRACDDATLTRLMEVNEGFRTFRDVDDKCAMLFVTDDALEYEPDAVQKVLLKNDRAGLEAVRGLRPVLAAAEWTAAALEAAIRGFGEQRKLGLGKVAQPLRVSVTGTTVSPPIFDTLVLLGRERTLARVDRCLAKWSEA